MKKIFIIAVLCPLSTMAQSGLTGIWKLKESKTIRGKDYVNAIPILMKIDQGEDKAEFVSTFNNGQKDTIINETLLYGEKPVNKGFTSGGRPRTTLFDRVNENWVKETEVFTKEDATKRYSLSKETYNLSEDGNTLRLVREYDGSDDVNATQDFIVRGTYEKTTSEQLARDTATGRGVAFVKGLTWTQIVDKAKKENKNIFVDCYATWCRPCKLMDKYVYPLNVIGDEMNEKFISVKVQMDTTKFDSDNIKKSYSIARMFEKVYNINALPTYLIFSPQGLALHKVTGQYDARKFLDLVKKSLQPDNQVYTLLHNAKKHHIPWTEYPALSKRLKTEFGEPGLAAEIAGIYYKQYLKNLPEKELLTKANLDFIGQYASVINGKDKLFVLLQKKPELLDSIKQYPWGSWSESIVTQTVFREDVFPVFKNAEKENKEPQWKILEQRLKKKYEADVVETYLLDARENWYEKKQDWPSFIKYVKAHVERHDLNRMDVDHLHHCAWNVFKYSSDTSLLIDALKWTAIVNDKLPKDLLWMTMDTKACLLYKIGRKQEGIDVMKKILEMFPDQKDTWQDRIDRMTRNEQIWLIIS